MNIEHVPLLPIVPEKETFEAVAGSLAKVNQSYRRIVALSDHLIGCARWAIEEAEEIEKPRGRGRPPKRAFEIAQPVALIESAQVLARDAQRIAVKAGRVERLRRMTAETEKIDAALEEAESVILMFEETLRNVDPTLTEKWETENAAHLSGSDAAMRASDGSHWGRSVKGDPERNTRGENHNGSRRDNNRAAAAISGSLYSEPSARDLAEIEAGRI